MNNSLHFPTWKILFIAAICLSFIVFALPNVMSRDAVLSLPEFMQSDRVNLGLDLQGGSHLLLEVDTDTVRKDHIADLRTAIRANLREKKIGYTELVAKNNAVTVTLRPDTLTPDANVRAMLNTVDAGLIIDELAESRYRIRYNEKAQADKMLAVVNQTIEIIGRRVNETGTKEPIIQQQGEGRILLQVPGLSDPQRLKDLLGQTAKLTFHMVNHGVTEDQLYSRQVPLGTKIFMSEPSETEAPRPYALFSEASLSGEALVDANASDDRGQPIVSFRFDTQGARVFGDITKKNIGKQFAVVLDGQVITAPVIRSAILGGSGIIEGNFTRESAEDLALLLRAGALPADLTIIEERSVGPSLGADSIAAGKKAAFVAVILVAVFMLVSYGLFGVFSNIALLVNIIILLGALSLLQATLTLPGIAGIVLTLGMAVDANVLIFERIREEAAKGRSMLSAVDKGFNSAFQTIMDSNLTTLIAAFVLFYFGSGTIKGFAVTLSLGILSSMFSAIMLTRLMIVLWLKSGKRTKLPI